MTRLCLCFAATKRSANALTASGYKAHSIHQMLKRRLSQAGLSHIFSPRVSALPLSQTFSNRMCRLKMFNILPGIQIQKRRRFTIGDAGA